MPHQDGKIDQNMYPPPPSVGGPGMFNSNQSLPFNNPSQPPPFVDTSQPPPFIDPNQPPPFVDTSQPPPFVDTSQPPPFMDPCQGPFPPPGPMFPMHQGPGFPMHDGNAQFPPGMPPPSQFGPPPFHGPPPPFNQPSGFPSPVPPSQPFQPMPVGPQFQHPPQGFVNGQQYPPNQSPGGQQFHTPVSHNLNDPMQFQQPQVAQGVNQNSHPPLPPSNENVQNQVMQQGFVYPSAVPAALVPNDMTPVVTSSDSASGLPVAASETLPPLPPPPVVRLPPKWKSAKDSEGRTYYYHVKTRVSQWEPPVWDQSQQPQPQQSDSSSESEDDSEEESSSTSEEEEEEDDGEEKVILQLAHSF